MLNNRGFSVLEILIAMTILVSALATTVLLAGGNRALAVDAQVSAEALLVAQEYLESAMADARKDFKLVNPTSTTQLIESFAYYKNLHVLPVDFFTKELIVDVGWDGTYGREQHLSLSSLITNTGQIKGGDTCYSTLLDPRGEHKDWEHPIISHKLFGDIEGLNDSGGIYPITDIEVYEEDMYVTINSQILPQGPMTARRGEDMEAVGSVAWQGPENVRASDDSRATALMNRNTISHFLRATNFGFSIPKGSTIVGIKVEVERSRGVGTGANLPIEDNEVRILKGDGVSGVQNKAAMGVSWPATDAKAVYGSSEDLWGEEWSSEDINSEDFGIMINVRGGSTGNPRTANIDEIRMTVYFTKQFYVIDLSDPEKPVFEDALESNSLPVGFNSVAVDGERAYVATNSSTKQLQIIDLKETTVTKTYALPDAGIANTVVYRDGFVFLGREKGSGPEFSIIAVHDPNNIAAPIGNFEVNAGVESVVLHGSYAFLATNDSARELIILDIRDYRSPLLLGAYNAPGSSGFGLGKSIYSVGDTLYMGRTYVSNAGEFLVLDVVDPSLITVKDMRDIGPNSSNPFGVYGIIVRDYLAFILTHSPSKGGAIHVVNTRGGLEDVAMFTFPHGGSGVAMDCEGNYLYVASKPIEGPEENKSYISIITAP
ncbi:MAG TPA: hypothetical protein VD928_00920 [Candidatus Paceibacterota bacterium]|nr:hypothetical protein [Candidatus Paceibacterota bacterium]